MNWRVSGGLLVCVSFLVTTPVQSAGAAPEPSTQPAANVDVLLGKIDRAYANLYSAEFDGRITGHFDIAGQQKDEDIEFTSFFRAPNQFKHDAPGDVIVGSTGQTAYAFQPEHNVYLSVDAPKGRASLSDWPKAISGILQQQNPAMLLALTRTAGDGLRELGDDIALLSTTNLDGTQFPTVQFILPGDHETVTLLIDPQTSLLRQARFDLRQSIKQRGTADVKAAEVVVDYTKAVANVPTDDKMFAWNPPVGAILATAMEQQEDAATMALVGKPAPDFTAPGLDDVPVKLSSMKGSVVLLDFWGLWCPQCLVALPGIDQIYKDQSPHGLKALAIDQMDENDAVKKYVHDKKLSIPVVLDPEKDISAKYGADSFPVTVLIGKDGIVKKVFLGVDNEEAIKSAVAKELAN